MVPCRSPGRSRGEEIDQAYELNTGLVIVERLGTGRSRPAGDHPACWSPATRPFAWGKDGEHDGR